MEELHTKTTTQIYITDVDGWVFVGSLMAPLSSIDHHVERINVECIGNQDDKKCLLSNIQLAFNKLQPSCVILDINESTLEIINKCPSITTLIIPNLLITDLSVNTNIIAININMSSNTTINVPDHIESLRCPGYVKIKKYPSSLINLECSHVGDIDVNVEKILYSEQITTQNALPSVKVLYITKKCEIHPNMKSIFPNLREIYCWKQVDTKFLDSLSGLNLDVLHIHDYRGEDIPNHIKLIPECYIATLHHRRNDKLSFLS